MLDLQCSTDSTEVGMRINKYLMPTFYHIICNNLSRKEISEDLKAFFIELNGQSMCQNCKKSRGEKGGHGSSTFILWNPSLNLVAVSCLFPREMYVLSSGASSRRVEKWLTTHCIMLLGDDDDDISGKGQWWRWWWRWINDLLPSRWNVKYSK